MRADEVHVTGAAVLTLTALEEAVSTGGSVQLQRSDEAGAVGTFSFSGVLARPPRRTTLYL